MAETKHIADKSKTANTKSTWAVKAVKGKITDQCLWAACKAMSAGLFLILVGTGMATVGFYSDQLSKVERKEGNITVYHKDERRDMHLSSLTYLGPIVMGVGGFIILATCVMTFEARDTASKIVPGFFRKSRIHVVQAMGASNTRNSNDTSWERFLANSCWRGESRQKSRSVVTKELKSFSEKLQSSIDSAKLIISEEGHISNMKKCPSEPFVSKIHELPVKEVCQKQKKEELQLPEIGKPKPKSLLVAANMYRQAASMDCPKRVLQRQEAQEEYLPLEFIPPEQKNHLAVQRSDSNSSMAMDLYLPQGAVTLHVKDKTKGKKRNKKHTRQLSVTDKSESKSSHSDKTGSFESDKTTKSSHSDKTCSFESQDSGHSGRKSKSPSILKQHHTETETDSKRRISFSHQSSTAKRNPLMRQTAIDIGHETKLNTSEYNEKYT